MKNLFLVFFLFIGTIVSAQNIKLNLIANADYNKFEYTYLGGSIAVQIPETLSIANTFALQAAFGMGEKMSFYTGIHYSKRNLNPRLFLGGVYGGLEDPTGTLSEILSPYLKSHNFKLLTIPVGLKFHPIPFKRVSPYFAFGFNTTFKMHETEVYKDIWAEEEWFVGEAVEIAIDDDEFGLYGVSFNLGLGLNIKVTDQFSVIFDHSLAIWEFRKGNEKFKKNGEMLYADQFLFLSQVSLGLGLQYNF